MHCRISGASTSRQSLPKGFADLPNPEFGYSLHRAINCHSHDGFRPIADGSKGLYDLWTHIRFRTCPTSQLDDRCAHSRVRISNAIAQHPPDGCAATSSIELPESFTEVLPEIRVHEARAIGNRR